MGVGADHGHWRGYHGRDGATLSCGMYAGPAHEWWPGKYRMDSVEAGAFCLDSVQIRVNDNPDTELIHRGLDPQRQNAAVQIVEAIADIEGVETSELQQIYECIDDMLGHLFENPPSPTAQVEVSFTYEGYRITVDQDGHAELIKVS